MKVPSALTIACAIAASVSVAFAQNYGKQVFPFSIRDGETLILRRVTSTTNNCGPLFLKVEGIDVLEGPEELTFTSEERMARTSTVTKDCDDEVPGAAIMVTAKDVTTRKEAEVVLRARMQTKNGPWKSTIRSHVLLFPPAGQTAPAPKRPSSKHA
jgi:hypothetical protein